MDALQHSLEKYEHRSMTDTKHSATANKTQPCTSTDNQGESCSRSKKKNTVAACTTQCVVRPSHLFLTAVIPPVTLFGHYQLVNVSHGCRHLLAGASNLPMCRYYCRQETDVSSRTGKKVCLRLWSCASARYGCV